VRERQSWGNGAGFCSGLAALAAILLLGLLVAASRDVKIDLEQCTRRGKSHIHNSTPFPQRRNHGRINRILKPLINVCITTSPRVWNNGERKGAQMPDTVVQTEGLNTQILMIIMIVSMLCQLFARCGLDSLYALSYAKWDSLRLEQMRRPLRCRLVRRF
jgi:hypothetical protein